MSFKWPLTLVSPNGSSTFKQKNKVSFRHVFDVIVRVTGPDFTQNDVEHTDKGLSRVFLSANLPGPTKIFLNNICVLSHSVVSDFLWPHGQQPARVLCPWDSPGKNTGMGCHALFQGIFLTQGLSLCLLCLLHCRHVLYPLSPLGSPKNANKVSSTSRTNSMEEIHPGIAMVK